AASAPPTPAAAHESVVRAAPNASAAGAPPDPPARPAPVAATTATADRRRRADAAVARSPLAAWRRQRMVTRVLLFDAALVALLIVLTIVLTLAGPLAPAPQGAGELQPSAIRVDGSAVAAGPTSQGSVDGAAQ